MADKNLVLVSACLAGVKSRYDGKSCPRAEIVDMVGRGEAVFCCPEQLGGCTTPRTPCELTGTGEDVLDGKARVISADGCDRTEEFIRGAERALEICRLYGIKKAYLKSKSPSCGYGKIYDGSFTGKLSAGNGVTSALLARNGIEIAVVD